MKHIAIENTVEGVLIYDFYSQKPIFHLVIEDDITHESMRERIIELADQQWMNVKTIEEIIDHKRPVFTESAVNWDSLLSEAYHIFSDRVNGSIHRYTNWIA
ncbi:MAG: hypothetical protein WKF85_01310 [Chitinophagaceae bacterium]